MLAFLFPGQGSQFCGMGGPLFDGVTEYARVEREVDRIVGYSVRELCARGPESLLRETRYTQPCLFVVNALHYYDARATHGRPAAVAGHSLGEYNALMAAGAFDLLTGVRLVARRAELMASAPRGAMAAVLRLPSNRVVRLLEECGASDVDVANYNAPQQTVIAGPEPSIEAAAARVEAEGGSCVPLRVSAPFHSRYMAGIADRFARFLDQFSFGALTMPVISNVTGRFYDPWSDSAAVRSLLVQQLTSPVQWVRGIRLLREAGVTSFEETGPGVVLTRLCQQMDEQVAA